MAGAILQTVLLHIVPRPANQNLAAAGTVRVRSVAVNIAFVNIVQSGFERDFPRGVKRFRRSARLVAQLEIRMKCGEMQRNIRTEMLQNPIGKLTNFTRVIVQSRNQ